MLLNNKRSCEVLVECGSEDALTAAEELEIGLYRLTLETPLACTEAALGEAEGRLEAFGGLPLTGLKSKSTSKSKPEERRAELPRLDGSSDGGGGGGGRGAAKSVEREDL